MDKGSTSTEINYDYKKIMGMAEQIQQSLNIDPVITMQKKLEGIYGMSESVNLSIRTSYESQKELNSEIKKEKGTLSRLYDGINNSINSAASNKLLAAAEEYIGTGMRLYEQQAYSKTRLAASAGGDIGKYMKIEGKAKSIENRGIYTDEVMLAGAMDLSKYFDDANAVASMMDTLSDYAAGMSGGGAVDAGTMARFADSIGRIAKGDYAEAEQNGFRISDAQKAVIEKLVPEDRYTGIYKDMSDDMRSAAVISEVLNQNVGGMYETVSNSPQGSITELKNSFSALGEEVGKEIYPSIGRLADSIVENMPIITEIALKITDVISNIIDVADSATAILFPILGLVADNMGVLEPLIAGLVATLGAMKISALLSTIDLENLLKKLDYLKDIIMGLPLSGTAIVIGILAGAFVILSNKVGGAGNAILILKDMFLTGIEEMILGGELLAMSIAKGLIETDIKIKMFIATVKAGFFSMQAEILEVLKVLIEKSCGMLDSMIESINKTFNLHLPSIDVNSNHVLSGLDMLIEQKKREGLEIYDSGTDYAIQQRTVIQEMENIYNTKAQEIEERRQARSDEIVSRMTEAFGEDIMPAERAAGMESEYFIGDIPSVEEIYTEPSFCADGEKRVEVVFESGSITNNISSEADVDEIMDEFANRLREAITTAAEGVYAY